VLGPSLGEARFDADDEPLGVGGPAQRPADRAGQLCNGTPRSPYASGWATVGAIRAARITRRMERSFRWSSAADQELPAGGVVVDRG
jgi:hypothetical protein